MKKYIVLCVMVLFTACGFRPMFTGNDSSIYVLPISGINGIELRNALNAKFGGPHDENAKYVLKVNLSNPSTGYKALDETGDATWQQITLTANYTVTYNGEQIASGREKASESYTFVRYLVAANASYNNAVHNTITALSDKIGTRVMAQTQAFENSKQTDDNK